MKKIIILSSIIGSILIAMGFFMSTLSAGSEGDIPTPEKALEECFVANCIIAKSGEKKCTTPTPKSITKFYCPGGLSMEDTAYQVVLDIKFREIDQKVEKWFEELSSAKTKGATPAELSVMIDKNFGVLSASGFSQQYLSLCDGPIVQEVSKQLSGLSTNNGIKNVITGGEPCRRLAASKIGAYRTAAWTIGTQNIVENYKSDKKQFVDQLKEKYRKVLMKFAIYTDKLSRIEKKWDKVIKVVQN